MKFIFSTIALTAFEVAALSISTRDVTLHTINPFPTQVIQVTEEERLVLLKQRNHVVHVAEHPSLGKFSTRMQKKAIASTKYPAISHQAAVEPLLSQLSISNMQSILEPFTMFHNRYFNCTYGVESSAWLQKTIQKIIADSGATGASVKAFKHNFPQNSLIATIPGLSDTTIVLGAHQDSDNLEDDEESGDEAINRAPGADDNGSGVVTILEAMRMLLENPEVRAGKAPNTMEFHWYAAEEDDTTGSKDVWQTYKNESRNVKAFLNQDMTGYSKGTTDKGKPDVMGVITDDVDVPLTEFVKTVIDAYCNISYIRTSCGGCSDHASVHNAGYPAAFVFESKFGDDSPYIHSVNDMLATLNYTHMLEHAKLSLGFAYELAFAQGL